jgi:hypothetical protein
LVIGLTAAVGLITIFLLLLSWFLGKREDELDDGDPNNPYTKKWDGK